MLDLSPNSLRSYKRKLREDLANKQIAYLASKRTFSQTATSNVRQTQNDTTSSREGNTQRKARGGNTQRSGRGGTTSGRGGTTSGRGGNTQRKARGGNTQRKARGGTTQRGGRGGIKKS